MTGAPRRSRRLSLRSLGVLSAAVPTALLALTWLGAVVIARVWGSFVIILDSGGNWLRAWVTPSSSVLRGGPGTLPGSQRGVFWYSAHDISTGVTQVQTFTGGAWSVEISHAVGVAAGLVTIAIAALLSRRAIRRIHRREPGTCTACGYSTHGLAADTCPECGAALTTRR